MHEGGPREGRGMAEENAMLKRDRAWQLLCAQGGHGQSQVSSSCTSESGRLALARKRLVTRAQAPQVGGSDRTSQVKGKGL